MNYVIQGMYGLGDNIYQRPFIKALAKDNKVYVQTCWAELYEDIENVYFLKAQTTLRTQSKNMSKQDNSRWAKYPINPVILRISYGHNELRTKSIPEIMYTKFSIRPDAWDLPIKKGKKLIKEKYAVIRPVTLRSEWLNSARNPLPEYIHSACKILKKQGYKIVSVADLKDKEEWLIGGDIEADIKYHNGELSIKDLIKLIDEADLVVGGVGFIAPMSMSLGTDAIIILGGHGIHNSPEKIMNDMLPENNNISFIEPDKFCMCDSMRHNCDKTITNFDKLFNEELTWLKGVS